MRRTARTVFFSGSLYLLLCVSAPAEPPAGIAGWQEAVLSVEDLESWREVFTRVAGWEVLHEGEVPRAWLNAWALPEQVTAEELVVGNPGTRAGWVRLVKFRGVSQRQIRSNAQTWETGGWFDINLRVRDMEAKLRQLQSRGWQGRSDPVQFTFGPFTVIEWLAMGPDGVALALIQRVDPPLEGWPELREMSRAFNATQIVGDMDAALDFYLNALGFEIYLEHEGPSETPGPNVLGLPHNLAAGISRQVYIVHPEGQNLGSVELLGFRGAQGRDFSELAVPPNLGILMLRFPISDVRELEFALADSGTPVIYTARSQPLAPYGAVDVAVIRGPNGEWIEFLGNMVAPAENEKRP